MPERTCIACRKKEPPEKLFRMVAGPGGDVYVELDSRLPGRGAYCCFNAGCFDLALEAGRLKRALRSEVKSPDGASISAALVENLGRRLEGILGAAWRKRVVSAGRDTALRACRNKTGGCLFLANDLSESSRLEVLGADLGMAAKSGPVKFPLPMARVGDVFGSRPVGVFFVADPSLANPLALRSAQVDVLESLP
ncbi:MAG: YlxR family protein [Nitrospinaceae bacterium]|nr:YlxR family protein [Nitrospinaceae bacterium]MBT3433148.1 YlxR family protein [Nitrospinaceae bacterium]MBT3821926.1 YlxR family protein [Nitrospinaceae bacterium]MBT4095490.1 YlxR family protein [Nitrospinaceae bacterium]MBT4429460.1 YlxR family protein [Nitrospinaceae bacterium]